MKTYLFIFIVATFFSSCSNNHFKIVSDFIIQSDGTDNKIITAYEMNYDPENIDWRKYEDFAKSLVDSKGSNFEIFFFNDVGNTPSLNTKHSVIDTNYQSFCVAKYTRDEDDSLIFRKYPFKIELGIEDIIMNEDSTYNISVYAISPFEIAGYQIKIAPNNIFSFSSIVGGNISGKYGFTFNFSTNMVLSFSLDGSAIPKSNSREEKDNILFTIKSTCKNHEIISQKKYYLDAIFASRKGEELDSFNEPFKITD